MTLLRQQLAQRNRLESQLRERCESPPSLRRIKAVLLLGGSLRPSPLAAAIDRSVLDLPVATGISILQAWQMETAELAAAAEIEQLPVRLLLDGQCAAPAMPSPIPSVALTVERDRAAYRGTAGVLRDATEEYDRNDFVLVAGAAQVLLQPLVEIARALAGSGADASLLSSVEGTPTNVLLLKCETLRSIPAIGFLDLKEQAFARMAKERRISVVSHRRPTVSVRSLEGYISALRTLNRSDEDPSLHDPFAEDWRSAFAIRESSASVSSCSRLHDSVVLEGGVVEDDATLFGSVVCAGGIVRRGDTVVRQVVRI